MSEEPITNDKRVDVTSIERQLSALWQAQERKEEQPVTRAALWNVVAHTWTSGEHAQATEVLGRASASVPQRTIIVQSDPGGRGGAIGSWISANCHLIGGGRQVCSEEVSIVASGERVHHIAPLVKALLLPDMPVAVWWLGDLPDAQQQYAETLLDPADRWIVDSSQFDSAADLELVSRIAEQTTTAPADLNWARLEEWRAAAAALFDPPPMRERLQAIRRLKVFTGGDGSFGANAEALLFAAWMAAQSGTEIAYDLERRGEEAGIAAVELQFADSTATIRQERARGVIVARADGVETVVDSITRSATRETEDLIVRLLKRPEADSVYLKTLKTARRLVA